MKLRPRTRAAILRDTVEWRPAHDIAEDVLALPCSIRSALAVLVARGELERRVVYIAQRDGIRRPTAQYRRTTDGR